MKIIFTFACSGMFRNVPACSMFRILSTAGWNGLKYIEVTSTKIKRDSKRRVTQHIM